MKNNVDYGRKYTPEMIEFMREAVKTHKLKEVLRMMNEKFGVELTYYSLQNAAKRYGCQCGLAANKRYTDEMIDFIRENCANITTFELADKFNAHFGTNVSRSKIVCLMKHNKIRNGVVAGFANLPEKQHPNAKATRFKKGCKAHNERPVGTESLNDKGYRRVKVAPNKWVLKHRLVYEEAHGKLKDDEEVIFLDGNKENFELSNLMKVSKSEHVRLNNLGLRTSNADYTKAGVGLVRLDQTIRKKQGM